MIGNYEKGKFMKRFVILTLALGLAGCGNTAVDNELVGQAKKLAQATPILTWITIAYVCGWCGHIIYSRVTDETRG